VRAEIVNTFTLTETLVSGRALVRYDIANAPVKELRVRVPAAFKNVEITGANIRSRKQDGDVWRVELQSPVRGFYTLTVTWDEPRAAKNQFAGTGGNFRRRRGARNRIARDLGQGAVAGQRIGRGGFAARGRGRFSRLGGKPGHAMALAYRYVRPGASSRSTCGGLTRRKCCRRWWTARSSPAWWRTTAR
jgi:hypothetical protein